jgi:hypothetical protein
MASTSVPASPQEATTRIDRGRRLFAEHTDDIRFDPVERVWLVPPQHDATSVYEVTLGRRGEFCECKDFEYRSPAGGCVHIIAATLARAKTALCDYCNARVPRRELVEVHEEHTAWAHGAREGDRFCRECAAVHGVL